MQFTASRTAALARLSEFLPRAGRAYANNRNHDDGVSGAGEMRSNVSQLSPWLHAGLIGEAEVVDTVLGKHSPAAAEKFIAEVFWRVYFKGYLEQRPSVWRAYCEDRDAAFERMAGNAGLQKAYNEAVEGRTGITAFDHWAQELVRTGYLHNHARMWFASIWIFTLKLDWQLGADFFLRHLMDGDAASNTLSWRWVAGLHTKGKTYQARASNIARYTDGRFHPERQLADEAEPLTEAIEHPHRPIPAAVPPVEGDFLLLITEEDGRAEELLPHQPTQVLGLLATDARSPLAIGEIARSFAEGAVADAIDRAGGRADSIRRTDDWSAAIIEAAASARTKTVVTAYMPVGPAAQRLAAARPDLDAAGITLHRIRRAYDDLAWPHATKSFFALKKQIPHVLRALELIK